jgi:hypothetical protein
MQGAYFHRDEVRTWIHVDTHTEASPVTVNQQAAIKKVRRSALYSVHVGLQIVLSDGTETLIQSNFHLLSFVYEAVPRDGRVNRSYSYRTPYSWAGITQTGRNKSNQERTGLTRRARRMIKVQLSRSSSGTVTQVRTSTTTATTTTTSMRRRQRRRGRRGRRQRRRR